MLDALKITFNIFTFSIVHYKYTVNRSNVYQHDAFTHFNNKTTLK